MMIFLTIALGCFGVVGLMVHARWRQMQTGNFIPHHRFISVWEVTKPLLERHFGHLLQALLRLAKSTSIHLLLWGREVILFCKYISTNLEKKFSRTIDLVKGTGPLTSKASTSFFLNEIKNHHDQIRRGMIVE